MNGYLQLLQTRFRNMVLNAAGVERDFLTLLEDGDVNKALMMMKDRSEDVDEAIEEYNPQTHRVMYRRDKQRKNDKPYEVEKLPRCRQRYINEVELFFLLGKPVDYEKVEGDDESYALFLDFIKSQRVHSRHRLLKRLAGSETEAALIYRLYNEDGNIGCQSFVVARSTGYNLRTLFDQYGNLIALAYGCVIRGKDKSVRRWEILTKDIIFECEYSSMGWRVVPRENLAGKICAIYARQQKAWDGVQDRIEREEMIDSKAADTNNYFADPVAFATADVVKVMGMEKDTVGKLIQYTGKDSQFGYIAPPTDSQSRAEERSMLHQSILFDSFTPDLSYDSIKGLGSLSGTAIENSLILGFIKRANREEIYGELFDREVNIIKALLAKMHPEKEKDILSLSIAVKFATPFENRKGEEWRDVVTLYQGGVISLETAVKMLAITNAPEEEIEKIKNSKPIAE